MSSKHYKGRGIEVRFESRKSFVLWALATYPNTNFKGLVFDRINNDGHYEPSNLRLTTQKENVRNGRRWKSTT